MFDQPDFSAGIWRGRKAPPGAVYDAQNALVDDEGNLARRGASAYKSNANAGDTLVGLFDGYLAAGLRTFMWAKAPATKLGYTLNTDDATPIGIPVPVQIDPLARGAIVNGIWLIPSSQASGSLFAWAGARKTADNTTNPTVGLTNGSPVMTGTATSWASLYEPGTMIQVLAGGTDFNMAAQSVDSNTQITLTTPWPGATGSYTASIFNFFNGTWSSVSEPLPPRLVTATGSVARLWTIFKNNRAYYSDPGGNGASTLTTNYIELPTSAYITGADSIQDALMLFTTEGVWTVANTDLDPIDDAGNVQWQQQEINRDVILWGDPGIVGGGGSLIVPAIDDVYILALDGSTTSISEGVRPQYRSYVNAGYQPGLASVHRGHYLLPIVNGTTLIDTLVCRLDRPTQTPSGQVIRPWTRWTGHAAGVAYAQRVGSTTRSPKLLGLAGQRVTELTATLDGQGATDADASAITFTATTNDVPLSDGTATRVRARYTATGASPAVAVEYSSDQDAGAFAALTVKGEQGGAAGWGASDGSKYQFANIIKKRDRIRFRFTLSGTATSFVLRAIEVLSRASGKQ